MGIKRKIILGFLSIGSLLLLSGIISTIELIRFNRSTYHQLELNRTNIELSKDMLDAVQELNTVLLMRVTDSATVFYDSLLNVNRRQFKSAFEKAIASFPEYSNWQTIREAEVQYNNFVCSVTDTTTIGWFSKVYKTSYYTLTNSIKEFMVGTQQQIVEYTAKLEESAYRATMVGIIALAAGVIIILMFYYMIRNYIVTPVLCIQKALARYLKSNLPYDVQVTTKDEINQLSQDIARLIQNSKK